jgi:transposase
MTESSLMLTLQKTIELQNQTIESLKKELQRANDNIEFLLKKLYGRKTEKTSEIDGQLVISEISLGLFNEVEVTADPLILEPVPFEEPVKKTRSGYKPDESHRNCPKCGDNLSVAGNKFLRSEIKYIPAEISIVNIYQETYECRKCKKDGNPAIFNPYTPEPVLQHSYATASSVAWTIYQKFVQAVPLYRQEKDWKQMGFPLSRATLSNWILKNKRPIIECLPIRSYFDSSFRRRATYSFKNRSTINKNNPIQ